MNLQKRKEYTVCATHLEVLDNTKFFTKITDSPVVVIYGSHRPPTAVDPKADCTVY